MSATRQFHLAVIGAGLYGIQAARTYLEIHPEHDVVVFEASACVGGAWSQERVYDEFWTQTPLGIAEFSDMPLDDVPAAEQYYGFFPAKHMSRYLEDYVTTRQFAGRSLKTRIRVNSKVLKLTQTFNGWTLRVRSADPSVSDEEQVLACKVIDATGLTSTPNLPDLPRRHLFKGTITHQIEFGKLEKQLTGSSQYENVIVLGGAKSAADMAYTCAKAGKRVCWVIRKSGAGPAAFVGAKGDATYKNSNESFYTRFMSHFLVSLYMDESKTMLGRFLYHTRIGRWLLGYLWTKIDAKARDLADYDRPDGQRNHYYNLKPDIPLFWQNDSTGVCQRDDFFDMIASHVNVYRQDVLHLTESGIVLADDTEIRGDIILCGTGWRLSHPEIKDEDGDGLEDGLGMATAQSSSPEHEKAWSILESTATREILARFPMLQDPPLQANLAPETRPLRLYKGIIPLQDQSIAFVGQLLLGNNFRVAEVQALFAVAVLDKAIRLPSADEMRHDIARHIAWNRCRYLKKGETGTWLYWDVVPYTDHLLSLLGLHSHIPRGRLANLFRPIFANDLRSVIKEYKDNQNRRDYPDI